MHEKVKCETLFYFIHSFYRSLAAALLSERNGKLMRKACCFRLFKDCLERKMNT